ncbi:hypothetical protein FQA39_LY10776 [Lamprigera yunnana]|nr:hypothetical protein FQA39_LY10776 [Lamprigera yunnana]
MNKLIVAGFFALVAVKLAHPQFTDEFDNVDIDEILGNQRLVNNYLNCIKTGKKCTADGLKARELIPQVLQSKCDECSQSHKDKALKILEWTIKNRSDDFLDIEAEFDSAREFRNQFDEDLKQRGINLPPLKS